MALRRRGATQGFALAGLPAPAPLSRGGATSGRAGASQPVNATGNVSIGVDIGGTFTDVVVRRPGAPARIMKIPSTRDDPSIAALAALEQMQTEWGLPTSHIVRFVHGTTVATNAVLERKGSRVGLITT